MVAVGCGPCLASLKYYYIIYVCCAPHNIGSARGTALFIQRGIGFILFFCSFVASVVYVVVSEIDAVQKELRAEDENGI